MAKPALGRGLGALLGGANPASASKAPVAVSAAAPGSGPSVLSVPLERVRPCPFQPRKDFSQESLQELADSIREQGVVQPLIVRPSADRFEIIAGERRWRAAQLAGLKEIPIVVREADDGKVLELALIENLQRENLNPLEEALGYSELSLRFNLTQEQVAQRVGKSRAVVANALRLLRLPESIQVHLREGRLSVGHAKILAGLEPASRQVDVAEQIIAGQLSVRQTEELLVPKPARIASGSSSHAPSVPRDLHVVDLESRLRERFGTRVSLKYRMGKGSLEVKFLNDDDLERILHIVGVEAD